MWVGEPRNSVIHCYIYGYEAWPAQALIAAGGGIPAPTSGKLSAITPDLRHMGGPFCGKLVPI
jgi:hypothetical protein